jgi:DNA (cytosine-5)-methyltransferase 1
LKNLIGIDLFCGAGGFSLGLGKNNIEIVLANEIEKDFAKTFKINHPKTKMLNEDIHNIDFKKELKKIGYKSIDVLCGGPPCQGFSTVGSKNKKDKRNSLFWEFLRAVNETTPRAVIFENVAGFKSLYNGQAYETLINELEKIGYKVFSNILNAADYGLPQFRKRTIIVGVAKNYSFEFPKVIKSKSKNLFEDNYLTIMSAISDLPKLNAGQEKSKYSCEPKNNFQKIMRDDEEILTEHNCSNYGKKMQKILSLIPPNGDISDLPLNLRPKKYFNNVYARIDPLKPSPTITRNFGTPSSSRCIHPFQNRALSTREGARLQGFPDKFIFFGSKTSKNLQIGNAVPPLLGEVIGKKIKKSLNLK